MRMFVEEYGNIIVESVCYLISFSIILLLMEFGSDAYNVILKVIG